MPQHAELLLTSLLELWNRISITQVSYFPQSTAGHHPKYLVMPSDLPTAL